MFGRGLVLRWKERWTKPAMREQWRKSSSSSGTVMTLRVLRRTRVRNEGRMHISTILCQRITEESTAAQYYSQLAISVCMRSIWACEYYLPIHSRAGLLIANESAGRGMCDKVLQNLPIICMSLLPVWRFFGQPTTQMEKFKSVGIVSGISFFFWTHQRNTRA